jgi:undecaprenyl-diphosphatase
MIGFISGADTNLLQFLYGLRDPQIAMLFAGITELGSITVVGIFALILAAFFFFTRRFSLLAGLMVSVGTTALIVFTLKEIVVRARPEEIFRAIAETGFSFPSGHAAMSFSLYGFLAVLAWKNLPRAWGWIVVVGVHVLVLLIGLSRLYLGVHYLSDVLASYIIAGICLYASIRVMRRFEWLDRLFLRAEQRL